MIPVKCHTTLLENVKLIQTVECSGQATKTNMFLFYNKKKQSMYGSKNNSICIQFFKIDYIQSSKTENKMRLSSD